MKLTIPGKWKQIPLENLLEFVTGGDWGKDETYVDENYALAYCIRGSEIKNWENAKGSTASLRKIKKTSIVNRRLKEGDILVEISGGGPEQPVGRTVVIDKPVLSFEPKVPKICTNFLRLIRPIKEVDSKYLNYYLKLFYASGEIVNYQGGSNNLRNLKFPNYVKISIPIPSFSEQQAIVSKIEELLSDLENGKQQLQTTLQQLKIYRQSLLKWAFESKLTNPDVKPGELPTGWKWVKTKDVIEVINNGYTPHKEYLFEGTGEIPFIKVYNLNFDGTLNFKKNPTFIPNNIHKKDLKRSICYPGDVLTNIVGPPLGKVSIVPNQFPEWNINQAIVLFRPNSDISSKYISYYLQNPMTINWLEDTSKATAGQWNIKVSTCREIPIPIPSMEEQILIVDELESKLTVCEKLQENITQSLLQSETLKQSILKKAFEGKLVTNYEKEKISSLFVIPDRS
jgi:type I restriction enzyme S subunit